MSELSKAERRRNRAGHQVLRRRGGPHGAKGYQRPQNNKELDDE